MKHLLINVQYFILNILVLQEGQVDYTYFPLSCDCRSSPPKTFFLFFGNSNSYYDFHLGSKSRVAVGASADQVIFRPLEIEATDRKSVVRERV